MKKFLRAATLALSLAFAACSLQACATGALTAQQGEMAGYDTLTALGDTADKLCTAGTLPHATCITVRNDLRAAKTALDKGQDITSQIATINGELK